MPEYEEETEVIEVPKAVGVAGYLKVVSSVLELPRVQECLITPGKVAYRRYRRPDEPAQVVGVDLTTLLPSSIVRSRELTELSVSSDNAAIVIAQMFAQVHMDNLNPIALVGGMNSHFWPWHARSTGVVLPREEAYGLPLLADGQIPDEALVMCAAYGRRAALVDTVRSYKITIPGRPR